MDRQLSFFHHRQFRSIRAAWAQGLNEDAWRWCLVFNLGNEMNMSAHRVEERLRYIAAHLLRRIYGNQYRKKKTHLICLSFNHGTKKAYNEHFHALIAIDGPRHEWSDFRIMMTIRQLDLLFLAGRDFGGAPSLEDIYKRHFEKPVHVD